MDDLNSLISKISKTISSGQTDLSPELVGDIFSIWDSLSAPTSSGSICTAGCAYCCYHWVEDVLSFELATIKKYLLENFDYSTIVQIRESARESERSFLKLYENSSSETDDQLLLSFMTLNLPCPLLDHSGRCMVYPVRPLTCRSFFSKNLNLCKPESVWSEESDGPYIFYPPDDFDDLLDELHFHFYRGEPTALRAFLGSFLL